MKKLFYFFGFAVILAFIIPANTFSQRTPGAIVYYGFDEIVDGTTVKDVSGVSPEIDLIIRGEVTALEDRNGIYIGNSDGTHQNGLGSETAPAGLAAVIQASSQITIEAWIMPVDTMQDDARVVSYSGSSTTRNFSLIIDDGRIESRIRTDITGPNGHPMNWLFYDYIPGSPSEPIHLVWTWYAPAEAFYINGALEGERDDRGSIISSWDNTFNLLIGLEDNHSDSKRQFIGEIYMVAIYDLALSAEEVEANYDAGSIYPNTADIPEIKNLNPYHIDLFPNPVSDNLTMKLDDKVSGRKYVTLHNCLGKIIMEESFTGNEHRLNMNTIPSGFYLMTVNSKQGNIVKKIIKE
jgi:hypothetical protein